MNPASFLTSLFIFAGAMMPAVAAPPVIEWRSDQPVLIQQEGHYGRIARLDAKTLIACFDWKRAIHIRRSNDEGKTWQEPVKVAEWQFGSLTNAELLVLKNGDVLSFFNRRPNNRGKDRKDQQPFSIGVSRSKDGGRTWSDSTTIYEAGGEFENGCWEPSGLQLPDGEVQVYFANEGPYRSSSEQEISMMRSKDNGVHWDGAEKISFRKGSRDGMPVPVLAKNGRTVAMAIEDNGLSGTFKPVIIASKLRNNGWREGSADGESSRRWGAMAKPLAPGTYAGAPYLRQLAGGEFVLSFQHAESGDMKQSRMAVSIGSQDARNFAPPTFPFPDDQGKSQLWNSLFIKNDRTVTAVSETSRNGVFGIWAVDGALK
jgi:hypothetical protein